MTPPAKRLLPPDSSTGAASSMATRAPQSLAASAAQSAALPLPTTTTSYDLEEESVRIAILDGGYRAVPLRLCAFASRFLLRGKAAVQDQRLPGDVRRRRAHQVAHRSRNLLGGAEPVQRYAGERRGATALTRMPCSAHSIASIRVIWMIAALAIP